MWFCLGEGVGFGFVFWFWGVSLRQAVLQRPNLRSRKKQCVSEQPENAHLSHYL